MYQCCFCNPHPLHIVLPPSSVKFFFLPPLEGDDESKMFCLSGTETSTNLHQKLYFHVLGTPQSEDVLCAEFPDSPKWMSGAEVCQKVIFLAPRRVHVFDIQAGFSDCMYIAGIRWWTLRAAVYQGRLWSGQQTVVLWPSDHSSGYYRYVTLVFSVSSILCPIAVRSKKHFLICFLQSQFAQIAHVQHFHYTGLK